MKTAFVTGADRGLGFALTTVLLETGYTVFAGQFMSEWPDLARLPPDHPGALHIVPLDVADDRSVHEAAELVRGQTDHIDLLVNNAGLFRDRSGDLAAELYFDDMLTLYSTNALGPLRVTHAMLSLLLAGAEKVLVNISSEAGSVADCWRTNDYGYSMSKSALNMQTALLHNRLHPEGVTVLAVHPGWVRSYMLGKLNTDATVEPIDSARGIVKLTQTIRLPSIPPYVDYQGNPLPW